MTINDLFPELKYDIIDTFFAKKIKKFGSTYRTECLEQASLELKTSEAIDSPVDLSFGVEEKNKKITAFKP